MCRPNLTHRGRSGAASTDRSTVANGIGRKPISSSRFYNARPHDLTLAQPLSSCVMSTNSNDQRGGSPSFPESPVPSGGSSPEEEEFDTCFRPAADALLSMGTHAPPLQRVVSNDGIRDYNSTLPFSPVGAERGPTSTEIGSPIAYNKDHWETFFELDEASSVPEKCAAPPPTTPSPTTIPKLSAPPPASQQQLETTKRTKRIRTAFTQNDFVRASVGRKGGPDVRVWLLKRRIGGNMGGKFMNDEMKAILIEHVQCVPQKKGYHYVVGLSDKAKKQATLRSAPQLVVFLDANMRQVGSEANHVHEEGHGHGGAGGRSGGSSDSTTAGEVDAVRVAPAFLVCECQHAKAIPWVSATTCYYGIRVVDFVAAQLGRDEACMKRCEHREKTQKRNKEAKDANAQNGKRVKATQEHEEV